MAYTRAADGTRLHYQVFGRRDGEPLLLVQGLGGDMRGWIMQRRALGRSYRCIAFDNRGVGSSDKPPGPYAMEVMAADAVSVLDAEGIEQAHVLGVSMGGIIAQILAVRSPERVRSLVLACTACRHLSWRRELLEEWIEVATAQGMGSFVRHNVRWLLGPRSARRIWPVLSLLAPIAANVPPHGFAAQARGILGMDDALADELSLIAVPTLVTVGSQDILTPLGDSEELAERIPGAELAVIRGGAHAFFAENAGAFNRTILDFLELHTRSRSGSASAGFADPGVSGPAAQGSAAAQL